MQQKSMFFGFAIFVSGVIWIGVQQKSDVSEMNVHSHHHGVLEIVGDKIPAVTLDLNQDPSGGWNVHIVTQNFDFSPENVNAVHVEGEGHGHLYVDDEKITRVYGEWLYLNPLPPGKHVLRVALNSNDHQSLTVNGQPIEAVLGIEQLK